MPGFTPIYGFPYQELADPPDGPSLGQDLAEAVETELERIDDELVTAEPAFDQDATNLVISNLVFAPGSPVVGVTFVAPPSGKILVTVTGFMESANDTHSAELGFEVYEGGVIGSGTIIAAADQTRAVATSRAVNPGAPARIGASLRWPIFSGLTAGDTYNTQTMHRMGTGGGSANIFHRAVLVEFV